MTIGNMPPANFRNSSVGERRQTLKSKKRWSDISLTGLAGFSSESSLSSTGHSKSGHKEKTVHISRSSSDSKTMKAFSHILFGKKKPSKNSGHESPTNTRSSILKFDNGEGIPHSTDPKADIELIEHLRAGDQIYHEPPLTQDSLEYTLVTLCRTAVQNTLENGKQIHIYELPKIQDALVKEVQCTLLSKGEVLYPFTKRLYELRTRVNDNIMFHFQKCTPWQEKFLEILNGMIKIFGDERKVAQQENRLQFFLSYLKQSIKDENMLKLIQEAINHDLEELNKVLQWIDSHANKKNTELINTLISQEIKTQQIILSLKSSSFEWQESANSSTKLREVNRTDLIQSFVRGGKPIFPSITINNEEINFNNIPNQSSNEDQYINQFFTFLLNKINNRLSEGWISTSELAPLTRTIGEQSNPFTPLLWSLSINAWANAEKAIHDIFPGLFNPPIKMSFGDPLPRIRIDIISLEKFSVTMNKSYQTHPFDLSGKGINKNKTELRVDIEWTLEPTKFNETPRWRARLKVLEITPESDPKDVTAYTKIVELLTPQYSLSDIECKFD